MKYIDAHTHVNFAAFKDDYREVVRRAVEKGVGLVNVGTQMDTSRRAVEIAHEFSSDPVFAAVGLHPVHTEKSFHDEEELGGDKGFTSRGEVFDYEGYKKLALDPKVLAIGECGLDYFRLETNTQTPEQKTKQREAFLTQIELAHEVKKPLMIHCREAYRDVISILKSEREMFNDPPGIIHFFVGSVQEAREFLDMGFYFTFGGVVTFARDYDEVLRYVPMDRILTETDAPYVTPVPYRGKRNEPSYVVEVVKKLSEVKGAAFEKAGSTIRENFFRVFAID